jgi:hypothetical protein
LFKDHASIPPLPRAEHQFYSDLASGDRERDGLLLGLRFFGLAATPLTGDALGDRDFAGDLDGERPFDSEREETDLDRDLDAERREGFFFGDLLGLLLLL